MKRSHWYVVAVMLLIAGGAFVFLRHRPETPVVDLVAQFAQAKKQPSESAFDIVDVTIDGHTQRSIAAQEQTRLTFHVTVPDHGGFRVALALKPEVWTRPGAGVLFLIGVSDGRAYHDVQSVLVDPYDEPADRRWHEVRINLDEYAGLTVDLILNTRARVPLTEDARPLLAVWGAPTVVRR